MTLGELDVIGVPSSVHSRSGCSGNGNKHTNRNDHQRHPENDLYDEVRRREREQVVSSGRGSWGRRPPTTKESLSSKQQHYNIFSAERNINVDGNGPMKIHENRSLNRIVPAMIRFGGLGRVLVGQTTRGRRESSTVEQFPQ